MLVCLFIYLFYRYDKISKESTIYNFARCGPLETSPLSYCAYNNVNYNSTDHSDVMFDNQQDFEISISFNFKFSCKKLLVITD